MSQESIDLSKIGVKGWKLGVRKFCPSPDPIEWTSQEAESSDSAAEHPLSRVASVPETPPHLQGMASAYTYSKAPRRSEEERKQRAQQRTRVRSRKLCGHSNCRNRSEVEVLDAGTQKWVRFCKKHGACHECSHAAVVLHERGMQCPFCYLDCYAHPDAVVQHVEKKKAQLWKEFGIVSDELELLEVCSAPGCTVSRPATSMYYTGPAAKPLCVDHIQMCEHPDCDRYAYPGFTTTTAAGAIEQHWCFFDYPRCEKCKIPTQNSMKTVCDRCARYA